jgi:ribonuclease P protein component
MLPRTHRLSRAADFERLFAAGKPLRHTICTLRAERNNLALTRVGIVCGKRVGGAVVRNRAKRRLREAMRQHQASVGDFYCALDELLRRRKLTAAARGT